MNVPGSPSVHGAGDAGVVGADEHDAELFGLLFGAAFGERLFCKGVEVVVDVGVVLGGGDDAVGLDDLAFVVGLHVVVEDASRGFDGAGGSSGAGFP